MNNKNDLLQRIEEIERELALLPPGSIGTKTIGDNKYYYHRYYKNGKRSEDYVAFENVEELRSLIERRKALEKELKELKKTLPQTKPIKKSGNFHKFATNVRIGEQLKKYTEIVADYKKRECYSTLHDYIYGAAQDKIFILFGLRRTGKTTLIRQIIFNMTNAQLDKTAFIQIRFGNTLSDINSDLNYLEKQGYKYVFIDEVTLMEDFIEGAALFSDIYASSGMRIVLSGTDSLGFVFSESEQLYDRCIMLHTTFIPYREFENILGIKGIDKYIQYGGTMSISGKNYNKDSTFANKANADEYVNTAIANNIQHSLEYYQDGNHFRQLYDLFKKGELTGAINRVVADITHRFTVDVLTKTFKSQDLSISTRNLLKDRDNPIDLNMIIDKELVTKSIKEALEILNKEEQSVDINEAHAYQIEEYLMLLDLVMKVDLLHFPNVNQKDKKTIISQPGLRYAQAEALVNSLLLDESFIALSIEQRHGILERILSEIKGRMMEDVVLLETQLANPNKQVFQLQFAVGEFDMVVHDPIHLTCEIYEIKHSEQHVPEQYKNLINEKNCKDTEHRFGKITNKYVIYRGKNTQSDGIKYLNVETYLKKLK